MNEEEQQNNNNSGPSRHTRDNNDELQQMFNVMMMGFIQDATSSFNQHRQQQTHSNSGSGPTIGSDIKLKLPDKFDGTRDITTIENFFSAIDKLKLLKGWDDVKTYNIATTVLDGRALAWINYLEKLDDDSTPRTWTDLKHILERFALEYSTTNVGTRLR
ncbi:unnamed protein product [Mucor hiemalis]